MERHFTATAIIVCQDKVLVQRHKKLGKWLHIGGHIHPNELPNEAVIREVKEETGLVVSLYDQGLPVHEDDAHSLPQPMHILLEKVDELHYHIDLIYYAFSDTMEVFPEEGETEDLRWMTAKELHQDQTVPPGVKQMSLQALEIFEKNNF